MAYKVSVEKSTDGLMGFLLNVTKLFSTSCLEDTFFIFTFSTSIILCLGLDLFGFTLCGSLCFLNRSVCFLPQVRNVFKYCLSLPFSSSSGTPIIQMLVFLMLSQRALKLSLFFSNLFTLCCSD